MDVAAVNLALFLGVTLILTSTTRGSLISDSHGNYAYDNGTITWGPLPNGQGSYRTNTSFQDDPLRAYFSFARGFLDTIQPHPVPFDMIFQLLDGSFDVGTQYMELVTFAIGFAICLVIGLFFVVLMPLCGCCFCCCRCCGKCGGKLVQKYETNDSCKRMGYTQALFLMALCIGASAACVYVTNEKVTSTLSYVDESMNNNFYDIQMYLNNTVTEFRYLAVDMYSVVNTAIQRDIDDIGQTLGSILTTYILGVVDPTINAIINMDTNAQAIMTILTDLDNKITNMKTTAQSLTDSLSSLQTNISNTKLICATYCDPTGTLACSQLDETVLDVQINFNDFPDLNATIQAMSGVTSQNLTSLALGGRQTILDLPDVITNTTQSARQTVKTTLNDFAVMIESMVDDMVGQLTGAFDLQTYSKQVGGYITMARSYDNYRFYGAVGLMSLLCVTVLILLLSMFCGVCGYRKEALPTQRGKCSNCGGCGLLCGVFLVFLLSSVLMLLTLITFILGGNMEKICEPLLDLSIFSEFIDQGGIPGFSIGAMLLGSNSTANISLAEVFRQCKGNAAPFNVLHLNSLIPLETYLDYNSHLGNINSQFDSIGNSFDLSSVNIMDAATEQTLVDFRDSGTSGVNFTAFQEVLQVEILAFDVGAIVSNLTFLSSHCTSPASDEWDFHGASLSAIDTTYISNIQSQMDYLNASLLNLQTTVAGIDQAINDTITAANQSQSLLQSEAPQIILNQTLVFMDSILNYVEQYKTRALHLVYNEMAECKPLWNLYDSFTNILCHYVVDSLNGFWFGLGWGLLFFVPSIIVAVKLSKHYRRMNQCQGYDDM